MKPETTLKLKAELAKLAKKSADPRVQKMLRALATRHLGLAQLDRP